MRFTHEQVAAHQAKHSRPWKRPVLQEFKDDRSRSPNHGPEKAEVDGEVYPKFRASITIRVSDKRDRDNDGAVSTIFDCLIAAIGRLAKMDPGTLRKHAASLKRGRGR